MAISFGQCTKHRCELRLVHENPKEPPVCVECEREDRERLDRLFSSPTADEDNAERARFGNVATPKGYLP